VVFLTIARNCRMVWVERDLKDHPVPTPAMSRDTALQHTRLPTAPASLGLGTSADGVLTALWVSSTALILNNFFLVSHPLLNFLSLVLSL